MAKKTFKDNPTMNFISKDTIDKVDKPEEPTARPTGIPKPPNGYKINHAFIETKNRRVQLLMQPSLYNNAKEIANGLGISVNDFIHRALQEATYNNDVLERIKADLKGE